MNIANALKIEKAELRSVKFDAVPGQDLISKQKILRALKNATGMKNKMDNRVAIIFRSKHHGLLKVIGTVLMTGKEFVVLRGGQTIPINCIRSVNL